MVVLCPELVEGWRVSEVEGKRGVHKVKRLKLKVKKKVNGLLS